MLHAVCFAEADNTNGHYLCPMKNHKHLPFVHFLSGRLLTNMLLLALVLCLYCCDNSKESAPTTAMESANVFIRHYLSDNKTEARKWIQDQDVKSLSVLDTLINKINTLDARGQRNLKNTPVTILAVNDQDTGGVTIRYLDPVSSRERILYLRKNIDQWSVRFYP